jgi:hypothetical protein
VLACDLLPVFGPRDLSPSGVLGPILSLNRGSGGAAPGLVGLDLRIILGC